MSRSRYRDDATPDYGHRFHAGNVGDVWKHCALIALLDALAKSVERVTYLESHAGEGVYELGPTGEWSEGVGKLVDDAELAGRDDAVGRYVAFCRRAGTTPRRVPARYAGSPLLARYVLGESARLVLFERDGDAFRHLSAAFRSDAGARLVEGDGLAALASEAASAESAGGAVVALVDPPWSQKSDWTSVPGVLERAVAATSTACFLLWYPVKSLTRPNAMLARLAAAGVAGVIAELVTTPLDQRRKRLNGSGVLLVRAPESVPSALAAIAPVLGARCATQRGTWSFRIQSWSAA